MTGLTKVNVAVEFRALAGVEPGAATPLLLGAQVIAAYESIAT